MTLIPDTAIVLRRLDFSETSQVLVMLTRAHGQYRLIAKGIKRGTKKRVAVGIDLLELGSIVFSQRPGKEHTLATLTEWRQEDTFSHLRRDLAKCYAGQYAAEVTSQLLETHDPHPALFDGLHRLLLSLKTGDPLRPLVTYLWLLLNEIGLRPELSRCVNCSRDVHGDANLYFSSRQGGAICRDCEPAIIEKRRIAHGVVDELVGEPPPTAAPPPKAAFGLLDYHLRELMSRPAKLSPLLRAAMGMSTRI
jgi:DNA repair protein RecO (recombination protein O)